MLVVLLATAGCGWVKGLFGDDDKQQSTGVSVFDVTIGQCFLARRHGPMHFHSGRFTAVSM
jgi:hypothetical protein